MATKKAATKKAAAKTRSAKKTTKTRDKLQMGGVVIIKGGGGAAPDVSVQSRQDDETTPIPLNTWTAVGNDTLRKTGVDITAVTIKIVNGQLRIRVKYE